MTSSNNNSTKLVETSVDRRLSSTPRTDLGNAERLVARFGDDIRYCPLLKSWFVWDGQRWTLDETGQVHRLAKQTARDILGESAIAREHGEDSTASELAKHARRSESEARLKSMVSLATTEKSVVITSDMLDKDPFLFNVENGTIDLRTGELREHRRGDLLTKLAPVEFDPKARAPRWEQFLATVLSEDEELVSYLQRTVGYSLTGDIREQVIFLPYGTGNNGKSTFLKAIQDLLGDYAQQADAASFLANKGHGIPNDIAAMRGSRMVSAVEVRAGSMFDEATVKQITGGDRIKARFLYKEYFEFDPTFKIWLAVNHKPEISHQDHAIWRRIRVIPFSVSIPEAQKDKKLSAKLREELSGILNWALEGCAVWLKNGLATPLTVELETETYREDMDDLGEFFEQFCVERSGCCTKNSLYTRYASWAELQGPDKPMSKKRFGMTMKERGYKGARDKAGTRIWLGIDLKQEFQHTDF